MGQMLITLMDDSIDGLGLGCRVHVDIERSFVKWNHAVTLAMGQPSFR